MFGSIKNSSSVFGVSNEILQDSYVDRGLLDQRIQTLLGRPTHVALRGESKCGKSWLRQKNIPNAVTVQCRLKKNTLDIYIDALSQLEIILNIESSSSSSFKGSVEASGDIGVTIIGKLGFKTAASADSGISNKIKKAGHDVSDLRFIADIIRQSGKRLVVEDFHYMSIEQRKAFAFDMKALWDYGVFVVVIGVWSQNNMLIYLNPDLSGRIEEVSIYWSDDDLNSIFTKGGVALNLEFSRQLVKRAIEECFGNAGILQKLILATLDELSIHQTQSQLTTISDLNALESAELQYADQLNPLYQQFARRVSNGIRNRNNSTGIYAHTMAAILEAPDNKLMKGISLDELFNIVNGRQPRIQKGNLRKVLEKFEDLQVDEDGRGLVLSYNDATSEVTIVDRQLLLYRRYATLKWPWEDMIKETDAIDSAFDAPN